MLILSWNVAGLSTTVHRIHDNYCPTLSKHPSAALEAYFHRHGADIICLQEHKIPRQQLASRSEPRQAASVPGYESFWSCCVDEKKKGLNGVVTYARAGTVLEANATPLGSPDLDQQGRCVMTDHGSFVLFNVYAPASGGHPMSYKMKFLTALRRAMHHQRQTKQKPVVLVGDLNISHSTRDIYWKDRVIYVENVLKETGHDEDLPMWKVQLQCHWHKITSALQTQEVVETTTTNTLTHDKYNKFRLAVSIGGRRAFLGRHETSPDYCKYCYDFDSYSYVDEETNDIVLVRERNVIRLQILAELMSKIAGIQWDDQLLRSIADSKDATIEQQSPPRQWLQSLILDQDGMVDTFRHFYPTADARFTCWEQFTNRRYINDGARIDYVIVDKELIPFLLKGNVNSLRCGGGCADDAAAAAGTDATTTSTAADTCENKDNKNDQFAPDSLTEAAALRAATANGQYQPVSFEGGGITEVSKDILDTQFGPLHTGMIYTPPSFSDHIAVCLLLKDDVWTTRILDAENNKLILNDKDPDTRKAQPHKSQKSIATFFTAGNTADVIPSATKDNENGGDETSGQLIPQPRLSSSSGTASSMVGINKKSSASSSLRIQNGGSSRSNKKQCLPSVNSILHHFRSKEEEKK